MAKLHESSVEIESQNPKLGKIKLLTSLDVSDWIGGDNYPVSDREELVSFRNSIENFQTLKNFITRLEKMEVINFLNYDPINKFYNVKINNVDDITQVLAE